MVPKKVPVIKSSIKIGKLLRDHDSIPPPSLHKVQSDASPVFWVRMSPLSIPNLWAGLKASARISLQMLAIMTFNLVKDLRAIRMLDAWSPTRGYYHWLMTRFSVDDKTNRRNRSLDTRLNMIDGSTQIQESIRSLNRF